MTAQIRSMLGRVAGALAFLVVLAGAGVAIAGGGNCGCNTTPPACCAPPTPPTPPSYPCCQPPGHNVYVPGVTVDVAASVVVNANVEANVSAAANASAAGQASSAASGQSYFFVGGGGGGSYVGPNMTSVVQGLNVEGGLGRSGYEASRTKITKVVIQAVCIDDKDIPHPASQVSPDRDIEDAYEGEIYRCIAGTHMQYVWAEYRGQVSFDHGQTVNCAKAEALWHSPGGKVECRAQKPARDCNERSLLRRFGAGVKILTMITIERYTAYREETTQSSAASSLSLDGGVGGTVY